jgi:hypothetical protein
MSIVKTEIVIVSQDTTYQIPGDWTQASVVSNYSASIPGISNMSCDERVETRSEGQVKVLTFRPRTGTKG